MAAETLFISQGCAFSLRMLKAIVVASGPKLYGSTIQDGLIPGVPGGEEV